MSRWKSYTFTGDSAQLRILRNGVHAWNAWRAANPSIRPRLKGANLACATLSHAELSDADLEGANLGRANLKFAKLDRADLTRAKLGGANLSRALLRGSILRRARLQGANFTDANLQDADLNGAHLHRSLMLRALMSGATLKGSFLKHARMKGVDLRHANLARADLMAAVVVECDLTGVDLSDASFAFEWGGEIDWMWGTTFDGATVARSGWSVALLDSVISRGAKLTRVATLSNGIFAPPSITLFFPRTLDFMSEMLVKSVLAFILGADAQDCQSTYEPTEAGGALVRLSGLPVEQLVEVAGRLSEFFDRPARAEITTSIEAAMQPAVDRAIEKSVPDVVARAVAPMAVLQAQLGEKIIKHIDSVYAAVERTEIKLSDEAVAKLREVNEDVLDAKLAGWRFEPVEGKLIRAGAWAVSTGAAGSGLFAALQGLLF